MHDEEKREKKKTDACTNLEELVYAMNARKFG
jgi:hypothetical protein